MLSRIEIQNFKAIQDALVVEAGFTPPPENAKDYYQDKNNKWFKNKPLVLDNLAQVNYLVGKNGSGKSSVLERIYEGKYNEQVLEITFKDGVKSNVVGQEIPSSFDPNAYTKLSFDLYQKGLSFRHGHTPNYTLEINQLIHHNNTVINLSYHKQDPSSIPDIRGSWFNEFKNQLSKNTFDQVKKLYEEKFSQKLDVERTPDPTFGRELEFLIDRVPIDIEKLSSGFRALCVLLNEMDNIISTWSKNPSKIQTCLIFLEEPENHLHPDWQKEIPRLINDRIKLENKNIQKRLRFLISTHSPFIISAAAKISENEFEKVREKNPELKKADFTPSQKVYQIEGGKTRNINGVWGSKSVRVSAEMLGAGLDSILSQSTDASNNNSHIIFCEGNGSLKDADLYNLIFKSSEYNCLFISCTDCKDVVEQFEQAKEFYKFQSGKINISGMVDNDLTDGGSKESWQKIGIKFLPRREFENYIASPEIVEKAFNTGQEQYLEIIGCKSYEDFKSFNIKDCLPKYIRTINGGKQISKPDFFQQLYPALKQLPEVQKRFLHEIEGILFPLSNRK